VKLALSAPFLIILTAWSAACLWFDGPNSQVAAGILAAGFGIASIGLAIFVRPIWRMWAAFAICFFAVQIWWNGIQASNDREWLSDVARAPVATIEGDLVTVENVRNFHYRSETDFDEVWETRTYDLSKLSGLDFYMSYWGSPLIAHTVVSWEFEDGQHLAISIETRKEVGESYSAILGFFRQYELYYVVADERDVIRLRTNHRGEQVFLYRLRTPVPVARALLVDYLEVLTKLAAEPRWYNALRYNCTTTIRSHTRQVAPGRSFSWKMLVNGFLDELSYDRGSIDTSLPFEELKRRSNITAKALAAGDDPAYSSLIREGLPGADRLSPN
jgi:hypothetical protein